MYSLYVYLSYIYISPYIYSFMNISLPLQVLSFFAYISPHRCISLDICIFLYVYQSPHICFQMYIFPPKYRSLLYIYLSNCIFLHIYFRFYIYNSLYIRFFIYISFLYVFSFSIYIFLFIYISFYIYVFL